MALKHMNLQDRLVSDGMRSMASTILNEHRWDPKLIKVALTRMKSAALTTELTASNVGFR